MLGRAERGERLRRRRTRWCGASAASWGRRRNRRPQRRGAPLLPADKPPSRAVGEADRRRADRGQDSARRRRASGSRGIEAVKAKIGVKAVYDLSATPFFLRGSGYRKGTLFPWVVSDFSLIDAIEAASSRCRACRWPTTAMTGELPTYRDLWLRIRDDLPKKGRKTEAVAASRSCRSSWKARCSPLRQLRTKRIERWEASSRRAEQTPPVFIVVCNNTNVSKLVFDYVGGWENRRSTDEHARSSGRAAADLFRNDDGTAAGWPRPNTILVDSEQLESGEAMSAEFKKIAAREIEEFKAEYRRGFPAATRRPDRRGPAARGDEHGRQSRASSASRCVASSACRC